MVAAIGVGIGTSMTTLAVFLAMTGDPIPDRSAHLYVIQIDSWGPNKPGEQTEDGLEENISYIDAMALMRLHVAKRQTLVYSTYLKSRPIDPHLKPAELVVPAVSLDFFAMFGAPFKYGGPWSRADDESGSPVVVISQKINDEFFAGRNSVGQTMMLEGTSYRVTGVLGNWPLVPRIYNLHIRPYGEIDEVFIPFTRAINSESQVVSGTSCKDLAAGFQDLLRSNCLWIQMWVELPTEVDAGKYRSALHNYAVDQQRNDRFQWPAHTQIRNVMQWLRYRHIVPNELGLLVLASLGFLFVCLLNAMGLMLARIVSRSQDISVRRALGASRRAIIAQSLVETAVIGLLGAVFGLLLTALGLLLMQTALSDDYAALHYFNVEAIAVEVVLAVLATIGAGLYPTWRAAHIEPALQLKSE